MVHFRFFTFQEENLLSSGNREGVSVEPCRQVQTPQALARREAPRPGAAQALQVQQAPQVPQVAQVPQVPQV